ncbi:MAG TPA: methyltransferase [Flavobacteriales bacterium]|nr:methyltransferase [Flavobacteriales bacterium]
MKKYKPIRAPVSYYGGKANLVSTILKLIPDHKIYTESFFGSGVVFFAKKPVESEVINDKNDLIINFYEQCISNFDELKLKIESTLFSRSTYTVAMSIWRMPHLFNKIQQAWAFYVACNQGFSSHIGSWGMDKYGKRVKAFMNKKLRFDESLLKRLEHTNIESAEACKVIKAYDIEGDSFHYVDPPYVDTNCGHYEGYTIADYKRLLDTLSEIKGKFLLSSFPTDILDEYIQKNGWYSIQLTKTKTAAKAKLGEPRTAKKIEVLTANYPISLDDL